MALSSTKIIKVIVVADDPERTAAAYRALLGADREPEPEKLPHRQVRAPYTRYLGKEITDTPMKVASVLSENFWFEIIQPLGDNDPWAAPARLLRPVARLPSAEIRALRPVVTPEAGILSARVFEYYSGDACFASGLKAHGKSARPAASYPINVKRWECTS